jgi:DNA-binding NarL/FixJ family response regulator
MRTLHRHSDLLVLLPALAAILAFLSAVILPSSLQAQELVAQAQQNPPSKTQNKPRPAAKKPTAKKPVNPALDLPWPENILALAGEGKTVAQIAQELGITQNEVMLVMELSGK